MTLMRVLTRVGGGALLLAAGMTAEVKPTAPAQAPAAAAQNDVLQGHRLAFAGKGPEAIKAYQSALRRKPDLLEAWINGAVVWDSIGEPAKAAAWYRRTLKESPESHAVRAELGELELRRGRLGEARAELDKALAARPADPLALVARGRVALALNRPAAAETFLLRAVEVAPKLPIAWFWLGHVREEAGEHAKAIAAFDRAASADSYFTAARFRLARSLSRVNRVHEALAELDKLLSNDPQHEDYLRLAAALRPRLKDSPRAAPRPTPEPVWRPPAHAASPAQVAAPLPPSARVPVMRVGVGTTGMGRPLDWRGLWLEAPLGFEAYEGPRRVARAAPGQRLELRLAPGKKPTMELADADGLIAGRSRGALIIKPLGREPLWVREKWPGAPGRTRGLERRLRGALEVSFYKQGFKLVNVVDLESYTHGVLSAEMPINSPMEALKAQAVLARTHALYIRQGTPRHREDAYELCDGQHCQVYSGVKAETERSRAVVEGTRGRIVTWNGRPVSVLYSSNCGGHAQASGEISGWGATPYLQGRPDAPVEAGSPWSPWELRQWLRTTPPAFCAPSAYIHPSHFRWARVITASELETRLDRSLKTGTLKWIQPLRRAKSGHLNGVEVRGSKASKRVESEIRIRGLFGPGSQRSSLFIIDAEYDVRGRPARYVFYGGGWGHAVGLCQSGAMGRALKGQSFAEILRSYYTGVEIGSLRY
ncbi:MAG: SpoIID/LytB domain-containing protein [Elusimicrobia bacterium]|nr:SpoIID/LytB domain-containing protein [Elusimicrobiota bacterium]